MLKENVVLVVYRMQPETLKRTLSAAFFAPLVLAAVVYMPLNFFLVFISTFAGIVGYEWLSIYQFKKQVCVLYGTLCCLLTILFSMDFFTEAFIFSAVIVWLFLIWSVLTFAINTTPKKLRAIIIGLLLVPAGAVSIIWIRLDWGHWLLIAVLLQIWNIDIWGYIVGKRWGNKRLIPCVSPNKTWEGFYAQLTIGLIFGVIMYYGFNIELVKALAITTLITLAAVLGDLYESVLKRENGVKDSGSMMVGHGGFLDRVDGLIAAAPFCWVLLRLV